MYLVLYTVVAKGWCIPASLVTLSVYSSMGTTEVAMVLVVGYSMLLVVIPLARCYSLRILGML